MKSVTRNNKLLLCFRPVVLEIESSGRNCSAKKVLTYIAVENKEDMTTITTDGSTLSYSDSAGTSEENGRPFRPKRTFSKIVKAVLFQTSLSKTVRDRKIRQDSFRSRSSSNLSTKSDNSLDYKEEKSGKTKPTDPNNQETIKSRSNSMRYSSSLSSLSSTSCPIRVSNALSSSKRDFVKPEQDRSSELKRDLIGFSSLLYLILVSLALTIFWGKFLAVLLTSIWLYFDLRRRELGVRKSENGVRWPEMVESTDYKKRVIMEGLLERSHHHHHNSSNNKGRAFNF